MSRPHLEMFRLSPSRARANNSQRKNGPPSSAVMIPTGNSVGGWSIRAAVSQITRNAPPKHSDSGNSQRWSGPTSKRQTCGATRPTKPIGPQIATTAPTIKEVPKNSSNFAPATFTPRLKAKSSPVVKRFRSSVRYQTIRQPETTKGRTPKTSWKLTMCSKPPITQRRMR